MTHTITAYANELVFSTTTQGEVSAADGGCHDDAPDPDQRTLCLHGDSVMLGLYGGREQARLLVERLQQFVEDDRHWA